MSVTGTNTVYISPIFRDPERFPGKEHNATKARWHGSHSVTGDASGGVYSISLTFSDVRGMLGNYALWDLTWLNINSATDLSPGGFCFVSLGPYERTNSTAQLRWNRAYTVGYYINNASDTALPQYKFRFSDFPGLPTQIIFDVSPNTNMSPVIVSAGGYIYDERLI